MFWLAVLTAHGFDLGYYTASQVAIGPMMPATATVTGPTDGNLATIGPADAPLEGLGRRSHVTGALPKYLILQFTRNNGIHIYLIIYTITQRLPRNIPGHNAQ